MQGDLMIPTVADVDRELARNLAGFAEQCEAGPVRFPSVGVTTLTILGTAERLSGLLRLCYLQEVIDQLNGWINDELMADPPCFVEYPERAEKLIIQGGG